jgi:enterochelin esterase family protein
MVTPPDTSPLVTEEGVTFRLARTPDLSGAWLFQEVAMPRGGWGFRPSADGLAFELPFPRPDVDRMEYLFELVRDDGRSELAPDPGNPLRAPGPFGDKSVVEFGGYQPPAWADDAGGAEAEVADLTVPAPSLGGELRARLWTPPGVRAGERVPLLVANDGIEYERYSALVTFLDRFVAKGELPPLRAALLHPVARDEHYSASPAYARALATEVLPHLATLAPTPPGRRWRVGMGASLGALAMLHAHRTHPATFGGLFLQSGSLFHHRYDQHDIGFEHFQRVRRFMDRVHATREWVQPVPVVITCGGVEMNLPNNRAAGLALRHQGYPVRFAPSRDGHNWTAWRDMFDPHLVALLRELWG